MAAAETSSRPVPGRGFGAALRVDTTSPDSEHEREISRRLREPVDRGSLTLADKAIAKLARAAVLGAFGVAPASATTGAITGVVSGALGRDLPRVDVARAGTQVDVEVEVASVWPHSAARVADAVRAEVATQLSTLADLTTGAVSVAVVKVVRLTSQPERRRVQ